jgi:hypothetical protein
MCLTPVPARWLLHPVLILAAAAPVPPAAAHDPAGVDQLIRQLGSDSFRERETANKALDERGAAALPALRQALDDSDPEVRCRAARLVEAIEARLADSLRAETLAAVKALGGKVDGASGERVSFKGTNATDADLARLARLPGLRGLQRLYLSGTKISDAGLVHLQGFRELEYLSLDGTAVTDAGLVHLTRVRNLSSLHLGTARVTEEAVARLKKSLPNLVAGWVPVRVQGGVQ